MKIRSAICAALISLLAPSAAGAAFLPTFKLAIFCKTQDQQCDAFVAGVYDTIDAMQSMPQSASKAICIPRQATLDDLEAVSLAFMASHKDDMEQPAANTVMSALAEAYPCR
jgi:hypothetical protein